VRFEPLSPAALIDHVVARVTACPGLVRLAVDGAPAADPGALADALVDPLRVLGRSVLKIAATGYLRPASLRYERGRRDPDARYDDWLDEGGLKREALAGNRVLPALWNPETDRASRAGYVELPEDGVIIVHGELLLGRGLPFDLTVHLWLSAGALARKTSAEEAWALPAFARYDREVTPLSTADMAVRYDHPKTPALRGSRKERA
jgi:hypothetical protein